MAEEDSEGLGNREDELPVREGEQQLLVEIFGEQKGACLGAGRAKIESFAGKRTKILEAAFGIAALDTGDAVGRFILRSFGIASLGLVKEIWLCTASRCRDINSPTRPLAHSDANGVELSCLDQIANVRCRQS